MQLGQGHIEGLAQIGGVGCGEGKFRMRQQIVQHASVPSNRGAGSTWARPAPQACCLATAGAGCRRRALHHRVRVLRCAVAAELAELVAPLARVGAELAELAVPAAAGLEVAAAAVAVAVAARLADSGRAARAGPDPACSGAGVAAGLAAAAALGAARLADSGRVARAGSGPACSGAPVAAGLAAAAALGAARLAD